MMRTYDLQYILVASPYINEVNFNNTLKENEFFQDYFIPLQIHDRLNKEMDEVLKNDSLHTTVFLYGYSGIGKTTYLRWYMRERATNYNNVFFDLTNRCIVKSNGIKDRDTSVELFRQFFYLHAVQLFGEYRDDFHDLLGNIYEHRTSIISNFEYDFDERLYNYIIAIRDKKDKENEFIKLAKRCTYKELFVLLLLFYFYYPDFFMSHFFNIVDKLKPDENKITANKNLPLLIIFDNIDHVEIEYQNANFPADIQSIYQNLRDCLYKLTPLKTSDEVHFIFCLRDANHSLINRQREEIIKSPRIKFVHNDEEKIFKKRLEIAKKKGVKLTGEQKAFFAFFIKDSYTKKSFLPLFNYNLRKLAIFVCDMLNATEKTYISEIKTINSGKYNRILQDHRLFGSRGIEYFLLIKHLMKKDFLNKDELRRLYLDNLPVNSINSKRDINPVRILLTNIMNESQYYLDTSTDNETGKSFSIDLCRTYKLFNGIFKNNYELFFNTLADLFCLHSGNWCHLITFFDKQVFSINDFNNEKSAMKEYIDYPENKKNEENVQRLLKDISVQLNPSGFVYIRDIVKHYEFFSVRAGNEKPLFCDTGFEWDNINNKINYNFLINIDKTYDKAVDCVNHLINFLRSYTKKDFSYTQHCFRFYDENSRLSDDYDWSGKYSAKNRSKSPGLHSVRLIDTHIGYIDTFRIFILNNDSFINTINQELGIHKKELNELGITDESSLLKDINKNLINCLRKYIDLLEKIKSLENCSASSKYVSKLIDFYNNNLKDIEDKNFLDFMTLINKDRYIRL